MLRIEELWAFVSSDAEGEGICGAPLAPGYLMVPLIGADKARIDSLIPVAKMIAKESGKKITLVRYSLRKEIMEIEP